MTHLLPSTRQELVSGGPCKASETAMDYGLSWASMEEIRILVLCTNQRCMRTFDYVPGQTYPQHEVLLPTPEEAAEFDSWEHKTEQR